MIEKFYARHIKNTLDAAAINVRRSRHPARPRTGGFQRGPFHRHRAKKNPVG
jgi:hypothetical protein